jgi:hypothetical protein
VSYDLFGESELLFDTVKVTENGPSESLNLFKPCGLADATPKGAVMSKQDWMVCGSVRFSLLLNRLNFWIENSSWSLVYLDQNYVLKYEKFIIFTFTTTE